MDDTDLENDIAENSVISQIDRVEAIRVQVEKFKRDLGTIPQQNTVIAKTLENMNHLEKDVGRLAQQLRLIRSKIQDETSLLKEKERKLTDQVETMKYELHNRLTQLEEMDIKRMDLESSIKELKESRNEAQLKGNDTIVRGLQVELGELNNKIEQLEFQVKSLSRDVERKDQLIHEKNVNIASLNEELNELLEKTDNNTKREVVNRLSVNLIDRDSDDEEGLNPSDPNLTPSQIENISQNPSNIKKKYLVKLNDEMRSEIEDLKQSLVKNMKFCDQLKAEIKSLKERGSMGSPFGRESFAGNQEFGLDAGVFDMRATDMFREISKLNQEVNTELTEDKIQSIRESLSKLEQLGQKSRASMVEEKRESYNPYMDEDQVEKKEFFGRPSDPFADLNTGIENQTVPEKSTGITEADIEKARAEIQQEADKKIKDMQTKLDNIRGENNGKEITLGQLRTKLNAANKDLEVKAEQIKILHAKIEELEEKILSLPKEEDSKDKSHDEKLNELTVQYKKEVSLLTNKLEQLKCEMEYYKNHAQKSDPSIQFDGLPPAPEHQPHPGHSSEHHHGPSHYYPTPVEPVLPLPHQSILKVEELQPSLRTSEPLPYEESSPVLHSSNDLKQSTLMQSKIQKIEAGLASMAQSRLESRPRPQRDERTVALTRLNKEYSMTQGNLQSLRRKLEENKEDAEKVRAELEHADKVKAEEKIIVELESRQATCQSQKAILVTEYDICVKIEKELKDKIAALMKEIGESGKDEKSSAILMSALMQSRIVLEEKDSTPLAELEVVKEKRTYEDPFHLAVPKELETLNNPEDQFMTNTIPLAAPLDLSMKPAKIVKPTAEDEMRQRQKTIMNEKLSNVY